MAIGLVTALAGWRVWQTAIPIGLGFAIEIIGCILFEIFSVPRVVKEDKKVTRKEFYSVGVWFLFLIPAAVSTFAIFKLYPHPYHSAIPYLAALLAYAVAAFIATMVLKKRGTFQ